MATISKTNGKIVSKIKYKGEIFDTGSGGSGESTLKTLLDATKSCRYLFYYYKGTSVNDLISYSDTSSVTRMDDMFYGCSNLITNPRLDTSKVTNMNNMFRECAELTTIQLNTSSATSMSNTFQDCTSLTTIDITHMNNISTLWSFANNCASLTKLIIRNMTKIPPLETNSFKNCFHFDGTTSPTFNPQGLKDGRIYVPDDKVEALKTATNWSVYADIIVPLSTLVE